MNRLSVNIKVDRESDRITKSVAALSSMCEQAGPNPDAKQFWAGQQALRLAGIVDACSWPGNVKLEPISPWGKPRSGCESEIPTRVTLIVPDWNGCEST
ncbi:hypothetical protein [Mesorhizobium sp. M0619]|uniref:hypothetical protein n=1 Tax=unclassified Mesorhizobium TaxID=325217 RepID=UPI003336444B